MFAPRRAFSSGGGRVIILHQIHKKFLGGLINHHCHHPCHHQAFVFHLFRLPLPLPTHPARASMVARILTCLALTLPIAAGFLGRSMSPARLGVRSGSKSSLHMAAPTEVVIIGCGCPKRGMVRLARTGHAPTVIPAARSLSSCPTLWQNDFSMFY